MIKSWKTKYWKNKRKSNNLTKKAKQFQSKDRGKMPRVILCIDKIIVIIEARKQDVFDAVGNQATKSLESLSQKKDDVEKLKLC